ncbi:MAG TPA: hypothetical protein DCW60_03270 [Sutterella sp.]|nr:hypothetical protein [Sutterella sp.]
MKTCSYLKALLKHIFLHHETALIFCAACAFYITFYTWPYFNEIITDVPTTVVDLDRSTASRQFIDEMDASPAIALNGVEHDLATGKALVHNGETDVLVVIPDNFEVDLNQGKPTAIEIFSNGTYPAKGRAVYASVLTLSMQKGISATAKTLLLKGADRAQVMRAAAVGVPFTSENLFNPTSGYGPFTVSIVVCIILQSVMVFGSALIMTEMIELGLGSPLMKAVIERPKLLIATFLTFASVIFFWGLFIEGPGMYCLDLPSSGNLLATVITVACFACAIASLAVALSLFLGNRLYVTLCVIGASAPSVFLTGLVFPGSHFPFWVDIVAAFLPSTPGAKALLLVSQHGAGLSAVFPYLVWLLLLALFYGALTKSLFKRYLKRFTD